MKVVDSCLLDEVVFLGDKWKRMDFYGWFNQDDIKMNTQIVLKNLS